ncbi:hypothetical protein, partial [Promicromonospora sukumoe]
VTGLQAELDAKAPASHTHTVAQVPGLQAELDGKAPASHTHTVEHDGDTYSLNSIGWRAVEGYERTERGVRAGYGPPDSSQPPTQEHNDLWLDLDTLTLWKLEEIN